MKPKVIVKKLIVYLLGLMLIAAGANLAKLSGLGISPATSIPRALEVIFAGKLTLGTACQIVYVVLVALQALLLRKRFKPVRLLALLLTFVFGWMVDFTGTNPATFGHLMAGLPGPANYVMRWVYLIISTLLIGIGVFFYILPKWINLPAEGLADAIAQISHKEFGDCKTFVDTGCILIALILQLIFMGGFSSFTRPDVVVREGTLFGAIFVGQVVKRLNLWFGQRLRAALEK